MHLMFAMETPNSSSYRVPQPVIIVQLILKEVKTNENEGGNVLIWF